MKVGREVLEALDRTPAKSAAAELGQGPTSWTAGHAAPAPSERAAAGADQAHFILSIRRALPTMWTKVEPQRRTRREQKARLVELLHWLAKKQGLESEHRALRRYAGKGRVVEGRIDLRVRDNRHVLDVEVAFEVTVTSIDKLRAAHEDGAQVLLICGFATNIEDAVGKLTSASKYKNWSWLNIACLPC